ncbi:hypothetical protein PsorP6_018664 [Peronosclerospora sorghi]|nr:hypothetical protein PsorP6_018664 [Peronosclerospora sorghi]
MYYKHKKTVILKRKTKNTFILKQYIYAFTPIVDDGSSNSMNYDHIDPSDILDVGKKSVMVFLYYID